MNELVFKILCGFVYICIGRLYKSNPLLLCRVVVMRGRSGHLCTCSWGNPSVQKEFLSLTFFKYLKNHGEDVSLCINNIDKNSMTMKYEMIL